MLSRTTNLSILELLSAGKLFKIHPLVAVENISILSKAGSLKDFLNNWEKLANDPTISETAQAYNVPFTLQPEQLKIPRVAIISQEEKDLIDQKIKDILSKGAILVARDQFQSSLLLQGKRWRNRSMINLNVLNKVLPYAGCQAKYVRFEWNVLLYEFLRLCFELPSAPRISTKLMKVPISLLRKLWIRIITYLDNMLLMAVSREGLIIPRNTLIFLLKNLGF